MNMKKFSIAACLLALALGGVAYSSPPVSNMVMYVDTLANLPTRVPQGQAWATVTDQGYGLYYYNGYTWTATSSASGSVSVTSNSNDILINPTPGTGTFTVATTNLINALGTTASPPILAAYMGTTVTHTKSTAVAVSLPQAGTTGFGSGVSYTEINLGTGLVTITPTSSLINGVSSIALGQNQSAYIISDGTNWIAFVSNNGDANLSFLDVAQSFTKAQSGAQSSPTISTATFTPDLNAANGFDIILVHASCPCTIANPSNISSRIGQTGVIEVDQSSTGSDTITWGSQYKFAGATAPTLSTGASAQDYFSYYVKDATHVIVSSGILNAH